MVSRGSAFARKREKSLQNRPEGASGASRSTRRPLNTLFSSLRASKWSPRGPRGALGDLLGRPPGPSWALLGRPGVALGRSGALLGPSWALLEGVGDDLGPHKALLGRLWLLPGSILVSRRLDLDPSEGLLQGPRVPPSEVRKPAEAWREPAKSLRKLASGAVPATPKSQRGCGGLAKRTQSAGPSSDGPSSRHISHDFR